MSQHDYKITENIKQTQQSVELFHMPRIINNISWLGSATIIHCFIDKKNVLLAFTDIHINGSFLGF